MKYVLACICMLAGCSIMEQPRLVIPDMVQRSITPNIILSGADTGYPASRGLNYNDANVIAMVSDANALARAMIARLNGESNAEALIQIALGTTIAGLAMGNAPIAAAGGLSLSGLALGRVFTQANSPGHANALSEFVQRNTDLRNLYWPAVEVETCQRGQVSGTELTAAGAALMVGFDSSLVILEKIRQGLGPTIEQLQGAMVPQGAQTQLRARATAMGCPPTARGTVP